MMSALLKFHSGILTSYIKSEIQQGHSLHSFWFLKKILYGKTIVKSIFLEKNSNKDPVQTTQAAGFEKKFEIRLQSNRKNWPSELGPGGLD